MAWNGWDWLVLAGAVGSVIALIAGWAVAAGRRRASASSRASGKKWRLRKLSRSG